MLKPRKSYHDGEHATDHRFEHLDADQIERILLVLMDGTDGKASEEDIIGCLKKFHTMAFDFAIFRDVMEGTIVLSGRNGLNYNERPLEEIAAMKGWIPETRGDADRNAL